MEAVLIGEKSLQMELIFLKPNSEVIYHLKLKNIT